MTSVYIPPPTASPTPDDAMQFVLSPSQAADVAMGVVLMAAVVIVFVYMAWLEHRAATKAKCICRHGRDDHANPKGCKLCRCRQYIREAPDRDWRL